MSSSILLLSLASRDCRCLLLLGSDTESCCPSHAAIGERLWSCRLNDFRRSQRTTSNISLEPGYRNPG